MSPLSVGFLISAIAVVVFVYIIDPPQFIVLDSLKSVRPFLSFSAEPASPEHLLHLVGNESSGPLGRKVAALTFAVQAYFQHSATEFRIFNAILHLLNGLLIFVVCRLVVRLSLSVTAVAVALWLLLPLHGSTVFYIVQRMTQLATAFALLSLLFYVGARSALLNGMYARSSSLALLFIGVLTLAVLAKENVILILPWIVFLELSGHFNRILLTGQEHLRAKINGFYQYAGLLMILGFLGVLFLGPDFWDGEYATRPFTAAERLLTQVVILKQYLVNMLYVDPDVLGVFHDDFIVVKSVFDERFLAATVFWLVLLACAWVERKRGRDGLFLAVGSFIILHLIESTIVPLELYFEHRNYLPSAALFCFLALWIAQLLRQFSSPMFLILAAFILSSLFILHATGLVRVGVNWSTPSFFSDTLIQTHPNSYRANLFAANEMLRQGRASESLQYSSRAHKFSHNESLADLALRNSVIACRTSYENYPIDDIARDLSELPPPILLKDVSLQIIRDSIGLESCNRDFWSPVLDALWERAQSSQTGYDALGGKYVLFRLALLEFDLERFATAVPYMRQYQSIYEPDIEIASRLLHIYGLAGDRVLFCEQKLFLDDNRERFKASEYQQLSLRGLQAQWASKISC